MESRSDRLLRKRNKLGGRIFEDYDGAGSQKRKGMHWRTFEREYEKYSALSDQVDLGIMEWLDSLLADKK